MVKYLVARSWCWIRILPLDYNTLVGSMLALEYCKPTRFRYGLIFSNGLIHQNKTGVKICF